MVKIRKENSKNFLFNFFVDLMHGRTSLKYLKARIDCVKNYNFYVYIVERGEILLAEEKFNNCVQSNGYCFYDKTHSFTCKKCNANMNQSDVITSLKSGICTHCHKKFTIVYLDTNEIRINKLKSFL